jgi:flagellar biosynthesis component FlhA
VPVFDDPQTVIGMIIGMIIIVGGTFIGVSGHRRRERKETGER